MLCKSVSVYMSKNTNGDSNDNSDSGNNQKPRRQTQRWSVLIRSNRESLEMLGHLLGVIVCCKTSRAATPNRIRSHNHKSKFKSNKILGSQLLHPGFKGRSACFSKQTFFNAASHTPPGDLQPCTSKPKDHTNSKATRQPSRSSPGDSKRSHKVM